MQKTITEPENTVHGCPDKVSEQIPKCSDIIKYGQVLLHLQPVTTMLVLFHLQMAKLQNM